MLTAKDGDLDDIAERHHGSLVLASHDGQGATFQLTLPLAA